MSSNIQQIQQRRLVQLTSIAQIPLVAIGLKSFIEQTYSDAVILLVAAALLFGVTLLLRKDRQVLASFVFLGILTTMVFTIQWTSGGVRDNSILVLPGILVFAAMIGALRFYNALLTILIINVLLMGWLNDQGHEFHLISSGLSAAINISVILFVVGFATRILTRDNLKLLNELSKQINEVNEAKQVVEHQAHHDHLTGLPNRLSAEKRFLEIRHRLDRDPSKSAGVVYIDFDEFKDINDTLGHDMGDKFLLAKAKRLSECVRLTDTVCRIGGDEFLVLFEDVNEVQLAQLAKKLLQEVMIEETINDNKLHCTCSIGIICLPRDAYSYEQAVQRADIAMYRSKHHGKNQFHFYNEQMESNILRRYEIQNRLVSAILGKEFSIELQPIYSLENGDLVGAEALARWLHPAFGNITPVEFIPIAEASGTIDELFSFVLNQSLIALGKILPSFPDFYISVNISPSQLQNVNFLNQFDAVAREFDIPVSAIKFEITESQMINNDVIFDSNIAAIHQRGIGLLLDDFGTGYSNLSHLQKMQFETIKIDRSFIFDCYKDLNSVTLLKSIAAMAEQLDVNIIAEGIETPEELDEVKRLNIQKGQGYLWSKPIPVPEFIKEYATSPISDK